MRSLRRLVPDFLKHVDMAIARDAGKVIAFAHIRAATS